MCVLCVVVVTKVRLMAFNTRGLAVRAVCSSRCHSLPLHAVGHGPIVNNRLRVKQLSVRMHPVLHLPLSLLLHPHQHTTAAPSSHNSFQHTTPTQTPTGAQPPEGERKLYLLIEAPTEAMVKRAKQEIRRVIEELVEKAMRRDVGAGQRGRYNIM